MKAEPDADISMDVSSAQRLGLVGMTIQQLQLLAAMVMARPVSPCEAAVIMAGPAPTQQ
jgi:hypothetical protein